MLARQSWKETKLTELRHSRGKKHFLNQSLANYQSNFWDIDPVSEVAERPVYQVQLLCWEGNKQRAHQWDKDNRGPKTATVLQVEPTDLVHLFIFSGCFLH